ncbi:MAG: M1 family aminopeptidase [Candidatus Hydrothermarchaeales archaeon]
MKSLALLVVLLTLPLVYAGGGVDILHYDLQVKLVPAGQSMGAVASLLIEVDAITDVELILNKEMSVDEITVGGKYVSFKHEGNILVFPMHQTGEVEVEVKYTNSKPLIRFGGLVVGYIGEPGEVSYMIYRAAWYPILFGDRATASVSIAVPNAYKAITVGELVEVTDKGEFTEFLWRIEDTVQGVSFAAGEYEERSSVVFISDTARSYDGPHAWVAERGGIRLIEVSCYLNPRETYLAENCVSGVERVLDFYSPRFGGYPYARFTVIEMPEFFFGGHGAMGLIMLHPSVLRDGSEELLAHEIAHTWWGAMVSVNKGYNLQPLRIPLQGVEAGDANDLWLHEGLATYSSLLYLEQEHGRDTMIRSLKEKRQEYLKVGAGTTISTVEEDYTTGLYHATIYGKGAFVLHMLRSAMGDDAFYQVIETYLQEYKGKSASIEDFEGIVNGVQGEDMTWFFDEWIRGTTLPDYALEEVLVGKSSSGYEYITKIKISQEGDLSKMPVDITLYTEDGSRTKRILVDGHKEEVSFVTQAKPLYAELDKDYWILESKRSNNLYVINYPLSVRGIGMALRVVWNKFVN